MNKTSVDRLRYIKNHLISLGTHIAHRTSYLIDVAFDSFGVNQDSPQAQAKVIHQYIPLFAPININLVFCRATSPGHKLIILNSVLISALKINQKEASFVLFASLSHRLRLGDSLSTFLVGWMLPPAIASSYNELANNSTTSTLVHRNPPKVVSRSAIT